MMDKDFFIYETESVKDALKKLNKNKNKVVLVVEEGNILLGTITDGDIRRYILHGKSLENDIRETYNKNPCYFKREDFSIEKARKLLIEEKVELIPVLDEGHRVIDFITWKQIFSGADAQAAPTSKIDVPVVIMAGGKGSRLEPFTKIFPKPLIPIGDKPIIEVIIDEFKKQGVREFYVTLNIKGEMIESYFNSMKKDYKIHYIWEKNGFLGTVGSLKFLEDKINDVFIVSNCDVIVKVNFEEVIRFHKEQDATLTILSAIQHYKIPYGVIKYKKGGEITDIHEKPEYTFPVNAGVYVISKECLRFIPGETLFDMPDLIKDLISNNKKVFMYPVNEGDYIDIGQWEEYKKAVDKLQIFK